MAVEIAVSEVKLDGANTGHHPLPLPFMPGCMYEDLYGPNRSLLGAPIGVVATDCWGTLGGYARITTATGQKVVAITCHHVISGKITVWPSCAMIPTLTLAFKRAISP